MSLIGVALRFAPALASSLVLFAASRAVASEGTDVLEACASAAERGQVARHDGRLLAARTEFRRCEAAECPEVVRVDCARWNSEVEEETPSIVLRARDSRGRDVIDVRVSANEGVITNHLDGVAVELDPGRYDFRYETPSGAMTSETVLVSLGEHRREITGTFAVPLNADGASALALSSPILAAPDPRATRDAVHTPRPSAGPGPLAYVFASVSALSVGAFAYFDVSAWSGNSDLENGCGRTHTCTPAQVDRVGTDVVAAKSFLAAAVVFAGLATWQFLTPRRPAGAARLHMPSAPARGMQTPLLRF